MSNIQAESRPAPAPAENMQGEPEKTDIGPAADESNEQGSEKQTATDEKPAAKKVEAEPTTTGQQEPPKQSAGTTTTLGDAHDVEKGRAVPGFNAPSSQKNFPTASERTTGFFKDFAQSGDAEQRLAQSLSGNNFSDLTPEEQKRVKALRGELVDEVIQPNFKSATSKSKLHSGSSVDPNQLPAGIHGAYITPQQRNPGSNANAGNGDILIESGLTDADRRSAENEEMGEAIAARARQLGISVASGDAGARLSLAAGGSDVSLETHPESFKATPETDQTNVVVDGELISGVAAKQESDSASRYDDITARLLAAHSGGPLSKGLPQLLMRYPETGASAAASIIKNGESRTYGNIGGKGFVDDVRKLLALNSADDIGLTTGPNPFKGQIDTQKLLQSVVDRWASADPLVKGYHARTGFTEQTGVYVDQTLADEMVGFFNDPGVVKALSEMSPEERAFAYSAYGDLASTFFRGPEFPDNPGDTYSDRVAKGFRKAEKLANDEVDDDNGNQRIVAESISIENADAANKAIEEGDLDFFEVDRESVQSVIKRIGKGALEVGLPIGLFGVSKNLAEAGGKVRASPADIDDYAKKFSKHFLDVVDEFGMEDAITKAAQRVETNNQFLRQNGRQLIEEGLKHNFSKRFPGLKIQGSRLLWGAGALGAVFLNSATVAEGKVDEASLSRLIGSGLLLFNGGGAIADRFAKFGGAAEAFEESARKKGGISKAISDSEPTKVEDGFIKANSDSVGAIVTEKKLPNGKSIFTYQFGDGVSIKSTVPPQNFDVDVSGIVESATDARKVAKGLKYAPLFGAVTAVTGTAALGLGAAFDADAAHQKGDVPMTVLNGIEAGSLFASSGTAAGAFALNTVNAIKNAVPAAARIAGILGSVSAFAGGAAAATAFIKGAVAGGEAQKKFNDLVDLALGNKGGVGQNVFVPGAKVEKSPFDGNALINGFGSLIGFPTFAQNGADPAVTEVVKGGFGSDRRIKKDIRPVGHDKNSGLDLFAFRYDWALLNSEFNVNDVGLVAPGFDKNALLVGVMAQDVLANEVLFQAVKVSRFGFLTVDYEALGLEMVEYETWIRNAMLRERSRSMGILQPLSNNANPQKAMMV